MDERNIRNRIAEVGASVAVAARQMKAMQAEAESARKVLRELGATGSDDEQLLASAAVLQLRESNAATQERLKALKLAEAAEQFLDGAQSDE